MWRLFLKMPNKQYIIGRRKEYKVISQLKKEGFKLAQRSAGSHSPVDIWAVNHTARKIKLVQCKPDNMPMSQIRKLLEENAYLEGEYTVEFEVR